MNNEGKCPTVGLNPDRLDCKKAVVLQATDPEAETGATQKLRRAERWNGHEAGQRQDGKFTIRQADEASV